MIAALLLLLVLPSARADDGLGLWSATLAMGDDRAEVLQRTDAVRERLRGVASGFEVEPASADLLRRVRDAMIELDLGKLYRMLPEEAPPARSLHHHGRSLGAEGYRYSLLPSEAQRASPRGLLDFDASLTMRPVDHDLGAGQGYGVRQDLHLGTGALGHPEIAATLEGFLAALWRASVAPADPALLARARGQQPRLSEPTDLAVVAAFLHAAPEMTRYASALVDLHRVGSLRDGLLELAVDARLDAAAIRRAGYPALGDHLARLGDLLRVDVSLRDAQGRSLADLAVRSARSGVALRTILREGAIVPLSSGQAATEHAVRLTDPELDLRIVVDTEVRVDGLLLRVTGLQMPVRVRRAGDTAALALDVKRAPVVEITGTSAVSRWLTELADAALDLEAQGEVVFRAVAEGRDGRGAEARGTVADGQISGAIDLMVVDNALVRFGTRMSGRYLAPSDRTAGDGMRLVSRLLDELDEDYLSVRPRLAGDPTEAGTP